MRYRIIVEIGTYKKRDSRYRYRELVFCSINPSSLGIKDLKHLWSGSSIKESSWKLRHWAYSASIINGAKPTRPVQPILHCVIGKYAQFYWAYLASTFEYPSTCKLCILGEYAKFHLAHLPRTLNFNRQTCRVCPTSFGVLAVYAQCHLAYLPSKPNDIQTLKNPHNYKGTLILNL